MDGSQDDAVSFMDVSSRAAAQPSGASSSTERPHRPTTTLTFPQPLQQCLAALPVHVTGGRHLRLRTWYLHFPNVQYWTQSRIVDLRLSSTHWMQDVIDVWADHLHGDCMPVLYQVHPALPETPSAPGHAVLADVIVAQGAQHLRGSLATVYVPGTTDFYHVAIALPVFTSGLDILYKARLQFLLRDHHCTIRHGHDIIPITPTPSHQVEHGQAFTIHFHAQPAIEVPADQLEDHALRQTTDPARSVSSLEAHESETLGSDDEIIEGVNVYSLGRSTRHFFVRWATYNTVLLGIVSELQVPLRDIVGFHYLAAPTHDQHPAEEGLILQYTTDLPIGSPWKLTLIDIELHFHEATPTVDRKVHALPPQLRRADLLHHLHFYDYCQRQHDRCKTYWNNIEWGVGDANLYGVQHGLYLRIILPPPQDQIDAAFEEEIEELAAEVETQRSGSSKRTSSSCTSAALPQVHKAMRLLQIAIQRCQTTLQTDDPLPEQKQRCQCSRTEHRDAKPPTFDMSFTDEFLRAVDAMRTAADALPEFDDDEAVAVDELDPWIQQLHEAWNRLATIGPGAVERLGRVETWFTDHLNFQRCYHTRIAILGPDAHRWEDQLLRLWRTHVIPGTPVN